MSSTIWLILRIQNWNKYDKMMFAQGLNYVNLLKYYLDLMKTSINEKQNKNELNSLIFTHIGFQSQLPIHRFQHLKRVHCSIHWFSAYKIRKPQSEMYFMYKFICLCKFIAQYNSITNLAVATIQSTI